MTSRFGLHYLLSALIACLLLAACATRPPTDSGVSSRNDPEREARRARPEVVANEKVADAKVADAVDGGAAEEDVEAAASEPSVIDQILADRRRSDYPEVEMLDFGFTITEQVRIGSEARTDYERAISLLRSDRNAEGIAVLRQITGSTPDVTAPYIDLGIAYGRVGDFEKAEEALRTAELLSPEHPIIKNELGILYRKTGRFEEARASYEQALAVFQDFHFARRNLAVLCDLYLADLDCALANYRSYLDSVGSDPEVEIWVADLENRLRN